MKITLRGKKLKQITEGYISGTNYYDPETGKP